MAEENQKNSHKKARKGTKSENPGMPLAGDLNDPPKEISLMTYRIPEAPSKIKETPRLPDLDDLLARVTDENLHPVVDWGPPAGQEEW